MVIDVVVVVLLAVALIVGWRGGLVGRLGAWVGFAIGVLGSARWAPAGIDAGGRPACGRLGREEHGCKGVRGYG